MRLERQIALVTGGGTGIGRGISLAFARAGGRVALFLAADAKATTGTTIFVDGGIIPLGPQAYCPAAQTKP